MSALPVAEAAAELGVRPGTVRRWCRQGMPHQPGARGRGRALLVDVDVARQWLDSDPREALFLELADDLPRVLAGAAAEALRLADGQNKRALAGTLAAAWYLSTSAALDHLRASCPVIPELQHLPPEIERLRKIARE